MILNDEQSSSSVWADVLCDVARRAEELVCVLILRGSCEKKERRRRDGIVEIICFFFLVPNHVASVPRVLCVDTTAAVSSGSQVAYLTVVVSIGLTAAHQ